MEHIGSIISVIISLVTIAVAWGVLTAKVDELRREINALDSKTKELASKEHCALKHNFLEQTLSDMRIQLKEIMTMLKEMNEK